MHTTTSSVKKVVDHPYFGLGCFLALCLILPRYGAAPMMVGSAVVLSACVVANPERFRGRSGSLTSAMCLLAAVWAGAAVALLSWFGLVE